MAVVPDVIDGEAVNDPEVLYRRVKFGWATVVEGKWRLTSQAFNDRFWKPSVNRRLIEPDAAKSKEEASDGVVQLVASEVRAVTGIIHNPQAPQGQQLTYKLDVIARPIVANNEEGLPANAAHAQIESDPTVEARSRFDKIKDALGRLAEEREWVIEPQNPEG